jgi:hypothetical protein
MGILKQKTTLSDEEVFMKNNKGKIVFLKYKIILFPSLPRGEEFGI